MKTNNNKIRLILLLYAVVAVIGGFSCSNEPTLAGGATGAGNAAVSGHALYPDNSPVKNALVRVRPEGYVTDTTGQSFPSQPENIMNCSTDSSGTFHIDSLEQGTYCIEILDEDRDHGTLIRLDYSDTGNVILEPRVVTPVKNITGTVSVSGLPGNSWVQIYGIEALGKTDSLGRFEIDNLPIGNCEHNECEFRLRILTVKNGTSISTDYEVEIESGSSGSAVEIEMEDD